jgi:NTE family protein
MKFIAKPGLILLLVIIPILTGLIGGVTATAAESSRPQVGLALGGGGAMGFNHIGVLQWLEENRIPVDYISGTSMGGLVGALYAMGMTPREITNLVKNVDWNNLFKSVPPFDALDFRRKQDLLDFPAEIEIGAKDRIFIPNGLNAYQVYLLLSRIALPYSTVDNFNELSIPFSCVATDIRNAETVILRDGSLVEALRATMAIPGIFVPVERGDQLLVDGGLVNNVPADVVKGMGAERVIAVNCNDSNQGKDLRRFDSFMISTINAILVKNTREALKSADIVIDAKMEDATYYDWNELDRYIENGYRAAAEHARELRKMALNEADWQEYLRRRAARKHPGPLVPRRIEVEGAGLGKREEIRAALQGFTDRPVDPAALDQALTEIMGSGIYESIRYEMKLEEGIPELLITVAEKSYGPPFIRLNPELDIGNNRSEINLQTRFSGYDFFGPGSEFRADLSLGTSPYLKAEIYRPLSASGWFIAPQFEVERINNSFYQDGIRMNDFQVAREGIGLDVGYAFAKSAELRIGYQISGQHMENLVGSPLPKTNGEVDKLGLKWSYSKAGDCSLLPESFVWNARVDWYLEAPSASADFTMLESAWKWAYPVKGDNILLAMFSTGSTLDGRNVPLIQQFRLGGPFRLGAYGYDELRGSQYLLGILGYLKSCGNMPIIMDNLYLGFFLEHGGAFESWSDPALASDLSVGFVGATVLGNFYLGVTFGEQGQFEYNFLLGHPF